MGTSGGVAWVHQEDACDAEGRFGFGAQASEGVGPMSEKNMGSSIDDFMKEEGIFEDPRALACASLNAQALNCLYD